MIIEVKKTEINDGRVVCRGKLVFLRTDYVENCITGYYGTQNGNLALTSRGYMGDYFISPIIVSESEEVLVPFEKMNYELLNNIASGYFKEGEEVFIECKKNIYDFDENDKAIYKYEVLLNYVNIFKIKKELLTFTESDMRTAYAMGHLQKGKEGESFSKWIEEFKNKKNG
jgi:hypothetical protein